MFSHRINVLLLIFSCDVFKKKIWKIRVILLRFWLGTNATPILLQLLGMSHMVGNRCIKGHVPRTCPFFTRGWRRLHPASQVHFFSLARLHKGQMLRWDFGEAVNVVLSSRVFKFLRAFSRARLFFSDSLSFWKPTIVPSSLFSLGLSLHGQVQKTK